MLKEKRNRIVFLADDDADDRVIFTEALGELRVARILRAFSDGVELMDFLKTTEELPQIVFLDLNMPRKSGFECLQEIRSDEKFNSVSVAIFSTSSSRQDIDETYKYGADIYIQKPNNYPELKLVLRKVLRKRWNHMTMATNRDSFLFTA